LIISSWVGDKYGFPKQQPLGMIWVFLFAFALPWIQLLMIRLWKKRSILLKNKWVLYLVLWLMWTPLFFTISKSLIHPYIMPIMVPIALLITYWWKDFKHPKRVINGSLIFPVLALVFYIAVSFSNKTEFYINSDKYLIENIETDNTPIFHYNYKSYSGQFYSKGEINLIKDENSLKELLLKKESFLVIIPLKYIEKIDQTILQRIKKIDGNYKKNVYLYTP